MDVKTWRARELTRNRHDKRVQAIRCLSCRRLRSHPTKSRITCACGAIDFEAAEPNEDEKRIALMLYEQEIESSNIYAPNEQKALDDWRAQHPAPGDTPERKIILT